MKKIYDNIKDLIGNTPILELKNIEKEFNLNTKIYAKLEGYNLTGSTKDRAAYQMIKEAEDNGILKPNSTIIEPTSGNTGIALSAIGAARGYKVIIVMPDSMSIERRNLMKAYGAQVVLTEGKFGMKGAIEKASELAKNTKDSFIPSQFDNSANPRAHFLTTGPEIWDATDGKVEAFIAGIGTGGTISGVAKYLKEKNKNVLTYGVEPATSAVINDGVSGKHKIQGIGAGFIPKNYDATVVDKVLKIENEEAFETARLIAKKEGVLVGISSGAALCAAVKVAKEKNLKEIVVLLPDSGDRYLSSELFNVK